MKQYLHRIYEHNYKQLMLIPLILVLLAIGQISYQVYETGDFVQRGVSLKGGMTLTIARATDTEVLSERLSQALPNADLDVRTGPNTIIIEASDTTPEELLAAINIELGVLNPNEYSMQQVGSSLGASFFKEMFFSIGLAYLFMSLVVLITYRKLAPSAMVIASILSNMILTLAIFNLLGLKLSSAGIASFLMLMGFSIDTDILLSSRVLHRKEGSVLDRVYSAMGTGMAMNNAALAAVFVCYITTQSEVIGQIMIILLIGLIADIIFTWIQNAGLLRWYLEKYGDV